MTVQPPVKTDSDPVPEPDPDPDPDPIPSELEGKKVIQVALGEEHGACITEDGELYTWGINSCGQLGDGTTEDKHKPVKIMDNVMQVNLGFEHSACITKDGSLYTWGYNYFGQLGDGTTEDKHKPVKIMDNVAQVSLGGGHSACITKDGSLYTWGSNSIGLLGIGTSDYEAHTTPTKIGGSKDEPTTTAQTLNADTEKQQTIIPNETYNIYAVQDLNAGLIDDNILYIDQQTADENGKLDYDHGLKGKADSVVWFAVPMHQQDISGAEVKLDDLEYTGEEQFVHPVVKLDGEELTEGVDYYLEGAYSATDGGEYTVTIKGTDLYTGEVSVTYKVNGGKKAVTLGDVNGDSEINVTDIAMVAAHIKGIKALDENAVKAADVNGDSEVNVTDIAMIAAHIKGIKAIG